eukprot:scaffold43625_cov17-Prasinocladus_malaysianus.AAC.1
MSQEPQGLNVSVDQPEGQSQGHFEPLGSLEVPPHFSSDVDEASIKSPWDHVGSQPQRRGNDSFALPSKIRSHSQQLPPQQPDTSMLRPKSRSYASDILDGAHHTYPGRGHQGGQLSHMAISHAVPSRSHAPQLDHPSHAFLNADRHGCTTPGCCRATNPGNQRNGRPYLTCCRGCATSGGNHHDQACQLHLRQPAGYAAHATPQTKKPT